MRLLKTWEMQYSSSTLSPAYCFQVVYEVVDNLGDGPKVAKNGRGEDWWYEDKQVGVFINKMQ